MDLSVIVIVILILAIGLISLVVGLCYYYLVHFRKSRRGRDPSPGASEYLTTVITVSANTDVNNIPAQTLSQNQSQQVLHQFPQGIYDYGLYDYEPGKWRHSDSDFSDNWASAVLLDPDKDFRLENQNHQPQPQTTHQPQPHSSTYQIQLQPHKKWKTNEGVIEFFERRGYNTEFPPLVAENIWTTGKELESTNSSSLKSKAGKAQFTQLHQERSSEHFNSENVWDYLFKLEHKNELQSMTFTLADREEYIRKSEEKLSHFRNIQNGLLKNPNSQPACLILIGVDARPTQIGGYCINFTEGMCQYYAYPITVLPWELHDKTLQGNPAEFEMKNLMFALLLWQNLMKEFRHVRIYTDNSAIRQHPNISSNEYGLRVFNYMKHLTVCEGVKIQNKNSVHIDGNLKPNEFAQYILPADDLSRWRIKECEDFLRQFYGISKFQKSHAQMIKPTGKPWYQPTEYFDEFKKKVNRQVIELCKRTPCLKCGFMIENTSSFRAASRSPLQDRSSNC